MEDNIVFNMVSLFCTLVLNVFLFRTSNEHKYAELQLHGQKCHLI